ncbi:hypothetical protein B0J14DRAFT_685494 [Halenospora varia]|nr:hypothetical protein B0J14DRAFT_685494 [Halenospora varia]
MAELGAIAGLIGTGVKLSVTIFEFGSAIGSAGSEVRAIGTEISLFCSVLKQLHSTLNKAKSYRYSMSALAAALEIVTQCQIIFDKIDRIIVRLQKRKTESQEPVKNFIKAVKWTFKKSKVQILRNTLKISTRRFSTVETQTEDEQEKAMTRSLIIAQRCVVDETEKLEQQELSTHLEVEELSAGQNKSPVVATMTGGVARNGKMASVWPHQLIDGIPLQPGHSDRRKT